MSSASPFFEYERRVAFSDTDMAGVAHFTSILRWVEEAEAACLRSQGETLCLREPDGRLVGWPKVGVSAEFLSPARFDEVVVIALTRVREGRSSRDWKFEIRRRDGAGEIARGTLKVVRAAITPAGEAKSVPIE